MPPDLGPLQLPPRESTFWPWARRRKSAPFSIPSTRVVDGRGGMLTPGFIDAHIHMHQFDGALPLPPLFLRFLKNREDVAERIAVRTEMFPEGTWIWGRDWVDATWGKQGPPTRSWLDQAGASPPGLAHQRIRRCRNREHRRTEVCRNRRRRSTIRQAESSETPAASRPASSTGGLCGGSRRR